MNTLLLVLMLLVAFVLLYVFVIRPHIRDLPQFDPFFDQVEAMEALLWEKSRTILVARLITAAGILLGIHDFVMPLLLSFNVQPLIPEQYQALYPVALALIGPVFEWLRKVTKEPLSEKE